MSSYTPYRDKMCQRCSQKPYKLQIANETGWVCEDCMVRVVERIENKPELKPIFDPIFKKWLYSSGYVNQEECEHFFIAGFEAAAKAFATEEGLKSALESIPSSSGLSVENIAHRVGEMVTKNVLE